MSGRMYILLLFKQIYSWTMEVRRYHLIIWCCVCAADCKLVLPISRPGKVAILCMHIFRQTPPQMVKVNVNFRAELSLFISSCIRQVLLKSFQFCNLVIAVSSAVASRTKHALNQYRLMKTVNFIFKYI
jgi:hypothetical protein